MSLEKLSWQLSRTLQKVISLMLLTQKSKRKEKPCGEKMLLCSSSFLMFQLPWLGPLSQGITWDTYIHIYIKKTTNVYIIHTNTIHMHLHKNVCYLLHIINTYIFYIHFFSVLLYSPVLASKFQSLLCLGGSLYVKKKGKPIMFWSKKIMSTLMYT